MEIVNMICNIVEAGSLFGLLVTVIAIFMMTKT